MTTGIEISRLCIPFTPFSGDLSSSIVCLVSTAGVHLKSDPPFDPEGDSSYREIPGSALVHELMITHEHYDHSDADRDINCVFPLELLRELTRQRVIAGVSQLHYGMGYTQNFRELRDQVIPQLTEELKGLHPDIVLFTGG